VIFHPIFDATNLKHVVNDIKILQKVGEERTYLEILSKNFEYSQCAVRNSIIRLEKYGLVKRYKEVKCRRKSWIVLTEEGEQLLKQIGE
jgi:DNA-binding MarR family transcriptional regulator